jgi:hypothetical protein
MTAERKACNTNVGKEVPKKLAECSNVSRNWQKVQTGCRPLQKEAK